MKPLLSLIGAVGLMGSCSTAVTSCFWSPPVSSNEPDDEPAPDPKPEPKYDDCFDQNKKNVTDQGSEFEQWYNILMMKLGLSVLLKEDFPDSNSFVNNLNGITSEKLIDNYFPDITESQSDWKLPWFLFDFTLLIKNYDSIDNFVIQEMKHDLKGEERGTYLFLNLPAINLEEIQETPIIDFQFIFMTKKSNHKIIGNQNNDWFFWNEQFALQKSEPSERDYFFDLDFNLDLKNLFSEGKRVVTNA